LTIKHKRYKLSTYRGPEKVGALSEQSSKQALVSYLSSDQTGMGMLSHVTVALGGSPAPLTQLNYGHLTP